MQVALTGCATGIGASVAAKLKAEGSSITAFDLFEPKDNTDKWIKTDFSDPQSIQSAIAKSEGCLLYTSPSPRDGLLSRMPSSA